MVHQTVQPQHADVQQLPIQNGRPASNHESVWSPFPLSGDSTQSGYSDGEAKISTSSSQGVHQSRTSIPQHSSQPSQVPSNPQWSNIPESNITGYRTTQTASFQDSLPLASTTAQISQGNAGQVPSNQNFGQNSYAQYPQTLKVPSNGAYKTIQNPSNQQPGHTLPHTYIMNQQQQQAVCQQPDQQNKAGPTVETVTDEVERNPAPPATEGSGIDARTKPEPNVEAARRAASTNGAPGSAEGRKTLLESALHCDLATYLVETVLENSSLVNVKDPASAKVHAVELLKLLCQDPGYGMKFKLILEKMPAWKKYVSQDHSLFITGHEQKADYFLTDGSPSDPMKLLTNSKG